MNKRDQHARGHEILTWKTLTVRKRKNHGRQPANLHYDRVRLQTPGIYNMRLIPKRRLTRGIYIGGNLIQVGNNFGLRFASAQAYRRRASLRFVPKLAL